MRRDRIRAWSGIRISEILAAADRHSRYYGILRSIPRNLQSSCYSWRSLAEMRLSFPDSVHYRHIFCPSIDEKATDIKPILGYI